jgi:hypothetical protein
MSVETALGLCVLVVGVALAFVALAACGLAVVRLFQEIRRP